MGVEDGEGETFVRTYSPPIFGTCAVNVLANGFVGSTSDLSRESYF